MRLALVAVGIVLGCGLAFGQESPPRSMQLEKLVAQKKEADEKFFSDSADPGDDLVRAIARYEAWPGWKFGTAFVEFAEAAPEDSTALAACRSALELCYAVGVTDRRIAANEERAWSLIEKYHLGSAEIGDLCVLAGRYPSSRRVQFLETVLADGQGGRTARALALGDRAKQRLFALEHLSIGAQSPEIEGLNLDGKSLKLSDFRGKVVLITFWFTGCGPCMAMLTQEKQLVEDLRGKPFQMVSVCNDPKLETAKVTCAEKGITWPNWFDGEAWNAESGEAAAGAIAKQWNVNGWPTIYVLDEKGIIRAKHLRGEGLDAFIHQLVADAEKH